MGWKEWGTGMVVFAFVGVQTVHAAHPFDSIKHYHTHVEAGYTHLGSTGHILFTTGGSGTHYTLTAESGTYGIDGGQVELRSA